MKYTNFAQNIVDRAGQVRNDAGGYSYGVDKWTQLRRFLILGSAAGSYYTGAEAMTLEAANAVIECLKESVTKTVDEIVRISYDGRAAKNSPAIFALAIAASPKYTGGLSWYALSKLSEVCRTSTHLFEFVEYVQQFRGWGRALRTAVANWYLSKDIDSLQYQLVKYQQRNGWSHKNIFQLAHPVPLSREVSEIFHWVTNPDTPEMDVSSYPLLQAFEWAKGALQADEIVPLIAEHDLPWEAVPTQWLKNPDVRMALLRKMPLTAMIRQLGIYSALGLTSMKSEGEQLITDALSNTDALRKARVHPFQMLLALQTYSQGRGQRGDNTWQVNPRIAQALETAFYKAFSNVESSGKRILLAIDISGSMGSSTITELSSMRASYAAAAQALVMVSTEDYVDVVAFDTVASPRLVNKHSSINEVMNQFVPHGGTDCGAPIDWAMKQFRASEQNIYDAFVIFTDAQTWAGQSNPYARFKEYQQNVNAGAKLATVAMVANRFGLSPAASDASVLDCIGFDTNTPQLISAFLADQI